MTEMSAEPRPECPTCGLLASTVLAINRCGLERERGGAEACLFPHGEPRPEDMACHPHEIRIAELESALDVALAAFCLMVDPDPEVGVLTNLKLQGEAQGIPLRDTYDAVVQVIAVLRAALDDH